MSQAKRLAEYVRGFARASALEPAEIAGVFSALMLEQLNEAYAKLGDRLTIEMFLASAIDAWRMSGRVVCGHCCREHTEADCPSPAATRQRTKSRSAH